MSYSTSFIHLQQCNRDGEVMKLNLENGPKKPYPKLRLRKHVVVAIGEVPGAPEVSHITTSVGLASYVLIAPDALEKELSE